jgi:hypothetical protein
MVVLAKVERKVITRTSKKNNAPRCYVNNALISTSQLGVPCPKSILLGGYISHNFHSQSVVLICET